ncbi:MAG: N-acetylmuramidase family protein [Janthinobacterium lividum]
MATISGSVGTGGKNDPKDVSTVQEMLTRYAEWLAPAAVPPASGKCDQTTIDAITAFQRDPGALSAPDGRVDPNGFTLRWLSRGKIPRRQHPIFVDGPVAHVAGPPSDADYDAAAKKLGSDVASIKAVAEVETGIRGSWDPDGRPIILFERHLFAGMTSGEFTSSHPDISNPTAGGYGTYAAQHPKLKRAAALNEQAALQAASWGGYQILGQNYASAGFATVDAFVSAQMESERRQLEVFVAVVLANRGWLRAFQAKDWTTFASGYNGPDYKRNDYDTKMKDAYDRLVPPAPKGPSLLPASASRGR